MAPQWAWHHDQETPSPMPLGDRIRQVRKKPAGPKPSSANASAPTPAASAAIESGASPPPPTPSSASPKPSTCPSTTSSSTTSPPAAPHPRPQPRRAVQPPRRTRRGRPLLAPQPPRRPHRQEAPQDHRRRPRLTGASLSSGRRSSAVGSQGSSDTSRSDTSACQAPHSSAGAVRQFTTAKSGKHAGRDDRHDPVEGFRVRLGPVDDRRVEHRQLAGVSGNLGGQ